jgi:rubrerythrin
VGINGNIPEKSEKMNFVLVLLAVISVKLGKTDLIRKSDRRLGYCRYCSEIVLGEKEFKCPNCGEKLQPP